MTGGIYSYLRHPMYAGLLAVMVGGSVVTESAMRLILTGLLYVSLDLKSGFEEERLGEIYGEEYEVYKREVTGKFFPMGLVNSILAGSGGGESTEKKE